MYRITRSCITAGLLAFALTGSACSDATAPSNEVASIAMISPQSTMVIGGTLQLVASTLNAKGVSIPGAAVRWTSRQPTIATVTPNGLVSGLRAGVATIRVTAGEHFAEVAITVEPAICSGQSALSTLVPGQPVTGNLTDSACQMEGVRMEGRRLVISEPTALRIDLTSAQFDATVFVTDLSMTFVAMGDEVVGTSGVRLIHSFLPGTYIVWATSFQGDARGAYTLSAAPMVRCAASTTAGTILVGQPVSGRLTEGSCLLPNDMLAEGWRFTVTTASALRFDAQTAGMTAVLFATGTGGALPILAVGDPDETAGATTIVHSFQPGEYLLWVGTFDGRLGSYGLTMAATTIRSCAEPGGTIAPGQTVQAAITLEDCRLPSGQLADLWQLTLAAPATLQLDQRSTEIDALLEVRDAAGAIIAQDDDTGGDLNARILKPFAAGSYTLVAMSYDPFKTGSYELSVQVPSGNFVLPGLRLLPRPKDTAASKLSWSDQRFMPRTY
ncbi:MAG: Ig-like domain-containing protein [Gemmatimonadaceae bacterium]